MTKVNEIYKCEACGNIVEVLHPAGGNLVCCEKDMVLFEEKTNDEGEEKHVPIVEETATGLKIKVGSVTHPMQDEHFIEWIEAEVNGKVFRQTLDPGMEPVAEFPLRGDSVKIRAFCNIHGLWTSS